MSRAVSVIIPSYNAEALLKQNLPAVIACVRSGDEIIIADDASSDGSLAWAQQELGVTLDSKRSTAKYEVHQTLKTIKNKPITFLFIKQKQNVRFGANVNTAVELAMHSLVFVINNDVRPASDVLHQLIPFFDDPEMFAVGCSEREISKSGQVVRGGRNTLWFQRGVYLHSRAEQFETGETAWVSGGSGLFSREKWLELGGFDKRFYPAYWEDIDLSFRARAKGWKVWFCAEAEVEHSHETTNDSVWGQKGIARLSWKHLQTFTWIHTNLSQKIQFLCWWPYHTWKLRKLWF